MKKILSVLLCFTFLISCAQKEIKKEDVLNQENVKKIANICKQLKIYDYNPSYVLNIEKASNITFTALINDLPIYEQYISVCGSTRINKALLKSGKQILTIRITPNLDADLNMEKEIDMEKAVLELNISCGEFGKDKVKDYKEVLKYELRKQKGKLPYYEVNLEFEASIVAYENDIEGWKNGVDLTKENKDKLLKEVENFYKKMIEYYEMKNVDALAGIYYKREFEISQANYYNKWFGKEIVYDSHAVLNEWINDVNNEASFVFSQYKMCFFGNGKMVTLVKEEKNHIDYSILGRKDKESSEVEKYDIFLYRPKEGAPLEVIR